jgi:catechol 2,3-dioxygenase
MRKGVMRPGHIQLRVMDMEEALKHYRDLIGLVEVNRDNQGRVYLKGWTEVDKYSVVLTESDTPGMDFVGYKVLNETVLNHLQQALINYGCEVSELPAGDLEDCGRRVRFTAPTGHLFELYAEKEQTGKWGISNVNPDAWPLDLTGMKAERFDHCLLFGPDVKATHKLFTEVLGFDLAEQVVDPEGKLVAAFLSVGMKAHDIAFVECPLPNKLHHVSFLVETWESLLKAADLLTMTNTTKDVGPTRHGLTHGQTVYFFDPSGNRNEVFCGGDYHYPDHPAVTWKAEDLGKAIFYHELSIHDTYLEVLT